MMIPVNDKVIIVGEIYDLVEEDFPKNENIFLNPQKTPIKLFGLGEKICSYDECVVTTNNAQFVEALSVISNDSFDILLFLDGVYKKIDLLDCYDYLGEVYDYIYFIKLSKSINEDYNINNFIDKYNKKWSSEQLI